MSAAPNTTASTEQMPDLAWAHDVNPFPWDVVWAPSHWTYDCFDGRAHHLQVARDGCREEPLALGATFSTGHLIMVVQKGAASRSEAISVIRAVLTENSGPGRETPRPPLPA